MDDEEDASGRKARQFAQLRRIGSLTMSLAEAAGTAALAEIQASPKPDALPESAPPPRRTDFTKIFMSTASAVRHIITLELRVEAGAAGAAGPRQAAFRTPPLPDPRRPLLKHTLHDAVRNHPDRARRRREIDACIEQELLEDPDGDLLIAETLGNICTKLHIEVDLARVSDAFLDYDEPDKPLSRTRKPGS